jgi:hypothetical protein
VIKKYEKEWDSLKEIALKVGKPENYMPNSSSNRYLETFSHYPTQTFNENLILRLTPDGEGVLNRSNKMPQAYGDCSFMLDLDYLYKVMEYLRQKGQASVKSVFMKFPDRQTKGRFSILWAVKYRILRFTEDNKK